MMRASVVAVAVGIVACVLSWFIVRPSALLHWCCVENTQSGFGSCFQSDLDCVRSKILDEAQGLDATTQDRAMCFEFRSIVRDTEHEECGPTVNSCKLLRAKFLTSGEYDAAECRPVDATERARRAQYPKVAVLAIGAAVLAGAAAWLTRRRRE